MATDLKHEAPGGTGYVGDQDLQCGWVGCERRGQWLGVHWPFCSIHHPAGRAHIEALLDKIDSMYMDLLMVDASADPERDPIAAIDTPAWLANALATARTTLEQFGRVKPRSDSTTQKNVGSPDAK